MSRVEATEPDELSYALVLGQGRSGTNYLLHLLNQSADTHCRNEPDQLEGSKLGDLAASRFVVDDPESLGPLWDEAVEDAALSIGPRDHRVQGPKSWIYPGTTRLGYGWLRQRYRLVHRFLRSDQPMFGSEVRFPRWMTSEARLRQAFHVFKLNAACGLGTWVLQHRPLGRAFHIVRHPGGFTKSWLRRWVDSNGQDETGEACRVRLGNLLDLEPEWAEEIEDPETLSHIEAELWFWRWVNERLAAVGDEASGYFRIIYEELAENPVEVTRETYRFCELPWTDQVERRVLEISRGSRRIASAWKDELERDVVESIEKVLHGSSLSRLWAA